MGIGEQARPLVDRLKELSSERTSYIRLMLAKEIVIITKIMESIIRLNRIAIIYDRSVVSSPVVSSSDAIRCAPSHAIPSTHE